MSLDATGAKNFYYYGKPSNQISDKTFPAGQKIWTQFPANVAKIRIGAIFAFTGYLFHAALKTPRIREWRWLVAILGAALAASVAYQHLLTKDPLVEAFYKIAGGKENYKKLPEILIKKDKKTYENFNMSWSELEHPAYRFTTTDGRKGLLVKGLSYSGERGILQAGSTQTQGLMIFVEKLGPYDVPRVIANSAEWVDSTLAALNYTAWGNCFSRLLSSSSGGSSGQAYRIKKDIYAWIPTDMANEFTAQKGIVNRLEPKGSKLEEIKDEVPLLTQ